MLLLMFLSNKLLQFTKKLPFKHQPIRSYSAIFTEANRPFRCVNLLKAFLRGLISFIFIYRYYGIFKTKKRVSSTRLRERSIDLILALEYIQ